MVKQDTREMRGCLNRGQEKGNTKLQRSKNREIKWDRYKFKEIMKS